MCSQSSSGRFLDKTSSVRREKDPLANMSEDCMYGQALKSCIPARSTALSSLPSSKAVHHHTCIEFKGTTR